MKTVEDESKWTLEQLAKMPIDFGKAKVNKTYEEAFQDMEWTQFIVSRYEESDKPEHRRFLRYVKLRIESADQDQTPVPPKVQNVKKVSKTKSGASHMAPPVDEEEGSDWEQMSLQHQSEMEGRMNRMEEALAQVISHLQKVSQQEHLIQPKIEQ